jgi:hypothetical protein
LSSIYNKFLSPTSILECDSHKIKIHVYFLSGHFEFRHFRPHFGIFLIWMSIPYLAIWGVNDYISRSKHVARNTIFRKASPSVVSGYVERSINLNKVVATFEKHTFLSQTDLTRTGIISNSYNEMFEAYIVNFYVSTAIYLLLHCDE